MAVVGFLEQTMGVSDAYMSFLVLDNLHSNLKSSLYSSASMFITRPAG